MALDLEHHVSHLRQQLELLEQHLARDDDYFSAGRVEECAEHLVHEAGTIAVLAVRKGALRHARINEAA